MKLLYIALLFIALLLAFYGGAIVGIADCKKKFNLPKGAKPIIEVEENEFI